MRSPHESLLPERGAALECRQQLAATRPARLFSPGRSHMIAGYATAAGTERYRGRFSAARDAGHFRHPERVLDAGELWFPSFGLGTYLGETDAASDARYTEAIA